MRFKVLQHQKLVHFLQRQLDSNLSKKQIRKILDANFCRVNGIVERFGTSDVGKGAVVELNENWKSIFEKKKDSTFEILYEDEYFLAINKPCGFVCTDQECKKKTGFRLLIHRLDKETTGVLLIAKNNEVKNRFIDLFKSLKVEKSYFAIVDGIVKNSKGGCKSFFVKKGAFQGQTVWGSSTQGLYAETDWEVISRGQNSTLIKCMPVTGRTHQIRVHLAEMGHPILTDRHYSKSFTSSFFAPRYLLHASSISFIHPYLSTQIAIKAPLPKDILESSKTLGLSVF